jgi:hypothetical protein
MKVSSLSKEYIAVEVEDLLSGADPTGNSVAFAFMSSSTEPSSGDFSAGSWRTGSDGKYYAQALIGPGGTHVLTNGTYYIWVKLTASPEIPIRNVGKIVIT